MKKKDIRILLVDDEPDILEIISYNLIQEGYQVITAENGIEAIEQGRKEKPHLKALLRRFREDGNMSNILDLGDIIINRDEYKILKNQEEILLPRKEFELLWLLASKPGKVFLREEIMEQVWGNEVIVGGRTIDVHIRKLREKIGEEYFKTIKGVGYKFEA